MKWFSAYGEPELAANRAEPVNQAEPVSRPDHDPKKISQYFLLVQHVMRSVGLNLNHKINPLFKQSSHQMALSLK